MPMSNFKLCYPFFYSQKEENDRKLAERPPIVARRCVDALHAEPFKPKLERHVTNVEPFNLQMTDRLNERKKYDETRERERALQKEKVSVLIVNNTSVRPSILRLFR